MVGKAARTQVQGLAHRAGPVCGSGFPGVRGSRSGTALGGAVLAVLAVLAGAPPADAAPVAGGPAAAPPTAAAAPVAGVPTPAAAAPVAGMQAAARPAGLLPRCTPTGGPVVPRPAQARVFAATGLVPALL